MGTVVAVITSVLALALLAVLIRDRRLHAQERAEYKRLMQLALQRQVSDAGPPPQPPTRQWRGTHLAVVVDRGKATALAVITGLMAVAAWMRWHPREAVVFAAAGAALMVVPSVTPPIEPPPLGMSSGPPPSDLRGPTPEEPGVREDSVPDTEQPGRVPEPTDPTDATSELPPQVMATDGQQGEPTPRDSQESQRAEPPREDEQDSPPEGEPRRQPEPTCDVAYVEARVPTPLGEAFAESCVYRE